MNCLIHQPLGLGDIFYVQPIVDFYISQGYIVYYPVSDIYYNLVVEYMKPKNGLVWVRESDDFPMKAFYGMSSIEHVGDDIYIPLSYSDNHVTNCGFMAAKYHWLNIPVTDWRNNFEIIRNPEREQKLIDTYGLHGDYALVNRAFGTNPRDREMNFKTTLPIHTMSMQKDKENGFNLFDWLSALENANIIHTVGTSICYLADKYCTDTELHIYERRDIWMPRTYHNEINLVYRNERWIYED
jgi:hypothetical protein